MRCVSCGREVAPGRYCGTCGAAQAEVRAGVVASRSAHFAADPDEHLAQPGIVSTLFPHLGRDEMQEFRLALAVGLALVGLLGIAGFVGAALLLAVVLVPALYLVYLYRLRVIRDAPIALVGLTFAAGLGLAVAVELVLRTLDSALLLRGPLAVSGGSLLLAGIAIPVGIEVLKALPPLVLRSDRRLPYAIDGLVLGVATGLGYAMGLGLIRFGGVIPVLGTTADAGDWTWVLASTAVIAPLAHGTTTGLVVAALWRLGRGARPSVELAALPLGLLAPAALELGIRWLAGEGIGPVAWLAWQGAVVAALLVALRVVLHRALLDEAAGEGLHRLVCPNCADAVTAAAFCPSCGVAFRASTANRAQRDATMGADR